MSASEGSCAYSIWWISSELHCFTAIKDTLCWFGVSLAGRPEQPLCSLAKAKKNLMKLVDQIAFTIQDSEALGGRLIGY